MNVRDFEQIKEQPRVTSGAPLTLIALSGACVILGILAFSSKRVTSVESKKPDPLAELAHTSPSVVQANEVHFPAMLSDKTNPATAFAVGGGAPSGAASGSTTVTRSMEPPPPTDRLPLFPLPAIHASRKNTVQTSPSEAASNDSLGSWASQAVYPSAMKASSGSEGGWQVQVASYPTDAEATAFADQLRARGHQAHVERAEIPKRGTWYRVRIGPFSQVGAIHYKQQFESREKLPAFVMKSGVDHY